jgi:hypothetical protein
VRRLSNFAVGNFPQRNYNLAIVRFDEGLSSFEELSCSLRRKHNQLKTVIDFL